jgi:hypothetical protein
VRTYRTVPALVAVVLFLAVGDCVLLAVLPSGPSEEGVPPEQEMWLVYFALMRQDEVPETLGADDLRRVLEALDPAVGEVADRVTIRSYTRDQYGFLLELEHSGDGKTYRITSDGLE